MRLDRRKFLQSSGTLALGAFIPNVARLAHASTLSEPFQWKTDGLIFGFGMTDGKLRQGQIIPGDASPSVTSSGVEVALQCTGENSPDPGMKSAMGQPGARLLFAGKREESTKHGQRLVCTQMDPDLHLRVESVYEAFNGVPIVGRFWRLSHAGSLPVGIDFLNSALPHGLEDSQKYNRALGHHIAYPI